MTSIHADSRVPLEVRLTLANAAMAYADVMINGDSVDVADARALLDIAVEDCHICLRAYELGMS